MATGAQTTWSEPPWSGWIETTGDALLILEAARRGIIPRVQRRLRDAERRMITSGSVFVFDEDESGIKRWTDGFFWSPSRILGNFLLYRETDKRGVSHKAKGTDDHESHSLSRPKGDTSVITYDRLRERNLVGSLTNSYKFKPDGLIKKTFSVTINGVAQHLISYYKIADVENGRLRSPSSLPELASLDISPEYLDKTHFRNPPKVEKGIDGIDRYRGEAEDVDLSAGLSIDEMSSVEKHRPKRAGPYDPPSVSRRTRKAGKAASSSPPSGEALPNSSLPTQTALLTHHASATYDNGLPSTQPTYSPPYYPPYATYYPNPPYPMYPQPYPAASYASPSPPPATSTTASTSAPSQEIAAADALATASSQSFTPYQGNAPSAVAVVEAPHSYQSYYYYPAPYGHYTSPWSSYPPGSYAPAQQTSPPLETKPSVDGKVIT